MRLISLLVTIVFVCWQSPPINHSCSRSFITLCSHVSSPCVFPVLTRSCTGSPCSNAQLRSSRSSRAFKRSDRLHLQLYDPFNSLVCRNVKVLRTDLVANDHKSCARIAGLVGSGLIWGLLAYNRLTEGPPLSQDYHLRSPRKSRCGPLHVCHDNRGDLHLCCHHQIVRAARERRVLVASLLSSILCRFFFLTK